MATNARIERLTREALGNPREAPSKFTKPTLGLLALVLLAACALATGL